ncbi:MAG TPA: OB-fold domain-containing protein, partial [Burkholderiales bacterium]|nr:OB-fold domain-containing protein [Burkholderiales bacterium]
GPEAVTFAELHDAFTCLEIISLEDVGLVPPGRAVEFTLRGATRLDGSIPVNVSGGLKARGHPVGASGLAQIVEMVWQIQGTLPYDRQVPRPDVGLALSIGGPAANNLVTLIERVCERPPVHISQGKSEQRPTALPVRSTPDNSGSGVVLSEVSLYVVAPGFPLPTRIALVEIGNGARVLAHCDNIRKPLQVGERVRISHEGGQFRAEATE